VTEVKPFSGTAEYCNHRIYFRLSLLLMKVLYKILYIPLKGCLVKEMYPKPEYREMSDLDILVKRGDAAKLKPVMESLGYQCERFGFEKDDSYTKNHLCM